LTIIKKKYLILFAPQSFIPLSSTDQKERFTEEANYPLDSGFLMV